MMLRRSWSHWALFGALFVAIVLVLGILSGGLVTIFGKANVDSARRWIDTLLQGKYSGFVGSAIVTAYGLLKAYKLGNKQLPRRLNEFLEREHLRNLKLRDAVVAKRISVAELTTTGRRAEETRFQIDVIEREPVDKTSRFFALRHDHELAAKAERIRSAELATAHFERGMTFAAAADQNINRERSRDNAIAELRSAIKLDGSDTRLFRACFKQLQNASRRDGLRDVLTGWVKAAEKSEEPREHGIARLELGQCIYDEREQGDGTALGITRELRLARDQCWAACNLLATHSAPDQEADPELSRAHELTGDIQIVLGNRPSALTEYRSALAIFRKLRDGGAIARLIAKEQAAGGDASGPSLPPPPSVRHLQAQYDLAEAKLALGSRTEAQQTALNAQRYLRYEILGVDMTDDHREDWTARIVNLLRRASEPDSRR